MSRTAGPDLWEWWCDLIEFHEGNSLPVAEICRMHDVSTASFYVVHWHHMAWSVLATLLLGGRVG